MTDVKEFMDSLLTEYNLTKDFAGRANLPFEISEREAITKWDQIRKQQATSPPQPPPNPRVRLKNFKLDGSLVTEEQRSQLERILAMDHPSTLFQFSQFLTTHYTMREKVVPCRYFPVSRPFASLERQHFEHPPVTPPSAHQKRVCKVEVSPRPSTRAKKDAPVNIFLSPMSSARNSVDQHCNLTIASMPARPAKKRPRTTTQRTRLIDPMGFINPFNRPPPATQEIRVKPPIERREIKSPQSTKEGDSLVARSVLFPAEANNDILSSSLKHQYIKLEKVLGNKNLVPTAISSIQHQQRFRIRPPKQLSFKEFHSEKARASSTYSQRKRQFEDQIRQQLDRRTHEKSEANRVKVDLLRKDIDKLKTFEDLRKISQRLEDKLKDIEVLQFKRKSQP